MAASISVYVICPNSAWMRLLCQRRHSSSSQLRKRPQHHGLKPPSFILFLPSQTHTTHTHTHPDFLHQVLISAALCSSRLTCWKGENYRADKWFILWCRKITTSDITRRVYIYARRCDLVCISVREKQIMELKRVCFGWIAALPSCMAVLTNSIYGLTCLQDTVSLESIFFF